MISFDTNAVISLLNDRGSAVRAEWRRGSGRAARSQCLSSCCSSCATAQPKRASPADCQSTAGPITVLSFEPGDAKEAGDVRAALERAGTPIGPYDVLIAAQARRRAALLVTANNREFVRVPGLMVEDWSATP
jgi:tRNA(fMet)-specific endonuclease VapC